MKKVVLNENDIKALVAESVKNVLKESYNDPNVISSTINIKNKVREYLYKLEEIYGDDMGNMFLNELFESGTKFLKDLNMFLDDNNRQEIFKY